MTSDSLGTGRGYRAQRAFPAPRPGPPRSPGPGRRGCVPARPADARAGGPDFARDIHRPASATHSPAATALGPSHHRLTERDSPRRTRGHPDRVSRSGTRRGSHRATARIVGAPAPGSDNRRQAGESMSTTAMLRRLPHLVGRALALAWSADRWPMSSATRRAPRSPTFADVQDRGRGNVSDRQMLLTGRQTGVRLL
jgi:hypothetical protein